MNNEEKRRIIFRWISDNNIKVAFLQETFCTREFSKFKDLGWSGEIKHNLSDSSHSRGVAIMFHSSLDYNIKNIHKKEDSRAILINATIENVDVTLCSVYAPNEPRNRIEFFKNLKFWIARNSDSPENIIIGGDFNCALNENDRKNNTGNTDTSRTHLKTLLKGLKLSDTWYIKNTRTQYTYTDPTNNSKSRIDYFFTSDEIKYKIKNIKLKHVPKKDRHKAVILEIKIQENKKGKGYWKLNANLLDLPEFEKAVKDIAKDCRENYNDLDHRLRWEILKVQVKDAGILIGVNRAIRLRNTIKQIQKDIDRLEKLEDQGHYIDANEKEQLKNDMEKYYKEKDEGYKLRS